jgi:hypothetical protein
MNTPAQTYIEKLRAEYEEQKRLRKIQQEAEANAKLAQALKQIKRTKPLEDQITELMRTLPPELRNRPWSMAELVNQLTGKYRDRPHPQQVGQALRRLGWQRERRWENSYDGVRIWLPPD